MKIRDIFERDPARYIPSVVKVDQHSDDVVGLELEEYVMTHQIETLMQEFIDGFLETRRGRTSDACVWISGFFGSGKSHFAKMLGYLVSNRAVMLQDGTRVLAGDYLSEKYGLRGVAMLTKELMTNSFFYNVLGSDTIKETNLSRYIYRQILLSLNYSEIPWVADIEESIQKDGLWDKFLAFVKETTGEDWTEIRKMAVKVRPVMVKALTKLHPELYSSEAATEKAISVQQEEHRVNPPRLVERLVLEAEKIDPNKGRIVLVLDEVGLYLKGVTNRLTELNSLAEEIEKNGKGKVWLIVTAQESLGTIDPGPGIRQEQIGWLRDRFTQKYQLDPRNIPQVVEVRLLKKRVSSKELDALRELFQKNEGQLGTACIIDDASRNSSIFKSFDWESFKNSYPLLPYHIPVMLSIFASLRAKGRKLGQESQLAGRERAVLSVVGPILKTIVSNDIGKGSLVTFDLLYDAIESVLQIVSSDHHHLITGRIAEIGKIEGIDAANVAKALFLLQQIEEWIPATSNNIAAMLYPSLGTSSSDHITKVDSCLQELKRRKWVREEGGIYRFLSEMERNFEDEVEQQSRSLLTHEITAKVLEITKTMFKSMRKYNHRKLRVFDVTIHVDDESIYKGGPHTLRIFTPLVNAGDKNRIEDLSYRSMGEERTVFWISSEDDVFASRIRRALALRKTLEEWTRTVKTPQELQELDSSRRELTRIEDELPRTLDSSLRHGTVIFRGEKREVNPKDTLDTIFNKWMNEFTQFHYTRFDDAGVRVKDKDIETISKWRGGKPTSLLKELKLVDSQGKPVLTGSVAHTLLQELKKTSALTEGSVLVTRFEESPFGWDESVIRFVLAFLHRQSSIQSEPENNSVFARSSEFRKARFAAGTVLSSEEISKAKEALSKLFGSTAGVTPEEISDILLKELREIQGNIQSLRTLEGFYQLPCEKELEQFIRGIERIKTTQSSSLRIRAFLEKETLSEIDSGIQFLDKLKRFIDGGHLKQLTKIRNLCSRLKRELGDQYPELSSRVDSLEEKISGKVIEEWTSIYDAYVKVSSDYQKQYLAQHERTQNAAKLLRKNIDSWIKENKVDTKTKSVAEEKVLRIACKKGAKGNYEEDLLLCKTCNRTLPTLATHEVVSMRLEDEVVTFLLEILAKKGKNLFDVSLQQETTVKTSGELQESLRKISDFAGFWIAKGKAVRLTLEGTAGNEE